MNYKKFASLILVTLLVFIVYIFSNKPSSSSIFEAQSKKYSTLIMEGVKYNIASIPNIPIVKFDSIEIRKRKMGPLTLGGWNKLFISELEIVIKNDDDLPKNYAPFLKDHIEIIKNEISSSVKVNFSNVEISSVKIFSFCSEKKLKMYARKASSVDKNCVKLEDIEFFRDNKKTEYLNEAILNITNNKLLFKNKAYDFKTYLFK